MSILTFAKLLLQIHIVIALGYLLSRLMQRLDLRLGWHRALLIASIALPLGLSLMPIQSLRRTDLIIPDPIGLDGRVRGAVIEPQNRKPKPLVVRAGRLILEPQTLPMTRTQEELAAIAFVALLSLASLLALVRLASDLLEIRHLLRDSVTLHHLGRVRVVMSSKDIVPFSVLLGRTAWVVLPARLLSSPAQLRVALLHELQHHRQRDTSWALLMEILRCAFALSPCVWLWVRELGELQELECDSAVLRKPKITTFHYASSLVDAAEAALRSRVMAAGTTAMASGSLNTRRSKTLLRRRIEMLTQTHGLGRWSILRPLFGTLSLMTLVSVAYGANHKFVSRMKPNPGIPAVDPGVQEVTQRVIRNAVEQSEAKFGFAIVADPKTGKILAIAGHDTTGKKGPRMSWPLTELVEPSSLMKSIVVAEAINRGGTTPAEEHNCEKKNYRYGERVYHDWKAFDLLSTTETVVWSSNICGIKIAERIGTEGMEEMVERFGFGRGGTAEEYPGAIPSNPLPLNSGTRSQYLPIVATGYSFAYTPLEIVQAYGVLANGGKLLKPLVADSPEQPKVLRQVISPETSAAVLKMLTEVVERGTASDHTKSVFYTFAGKTATSYHPTLPEHEDLGGMVSAADFIGFAPASAPVYEIYVHIDTPTSTKLPNGSRHAAPAFKKIAEELLYKAGVAPDRPRK